MHKDRYCVWVKAARRYPAKRRNKELMATCVAPRSWKLMSTSSWLNYHLRRDHFSRKCSFDDTSVGRCNDK
ncbi:MAG: hypothetical protein HQK83_03710 [Fibrobacteria bacterium]|nr:hypothetical protein [Fibrobacteria bacterium]